jgi:hypothetical protein
VKRATELLSDLDDVDDALEVDRGNAAVLGMIVQRDLCDRIEDQRVGGEAVTGGSDALHVADVPSPAIDPRRHVLRIPDVAQKNPELGVGEQVEPLLEEDAPDVPGGADDQDLVR